MILVLVVVARNIKTAMAKNKSQIRLDVMPSLILRFIQLKDK